MTSKHVLAIHIFIFTFFALASLSTPILVVFFPGFFSSFFYLLGAVLLVALVFSSWKSYGGCPFTVWENNFRKTESKETYSGSCLPHYAAKWLGLKLPTRFFTAVLFTLLFLPILVGVVGRYLA